MAEITTTEITEQQRLFRAEVSRNIGQMTMRYQIPRPVFGERDFEGQDTVGDALRAMDAIIGSQDPGAQEVVLGPLAVRLDEPRRTRQAFLLASGTANARRSTDPFRIERLDKYTEKQYRLLRTYFARVALVEEAETEEVFMRSVSFRAIVAPVSEKIKY